VDRYILDIAAAGGHLNILKWWNHRCIYPTSKGINNAIINNHLELAKWAVEHIKIRPNHIGANGAMACGNVIALKWLHSIGVRPSAVGANLAAANGYIMALEWSVNTLDMYPNNFRIAIKNNKLDSIIWAHATRLNVDYVMLADYAAEYGHLSILKWIFKVKDCYPTIYGCSAATHGGYLHILRWMHSYQLDIHPDLLLRQ